MGTFGCYKPGPFPAGRELFSFIFSKDGFFKNGSDIPLRGSIERLLLSSTFLERGFFKLFVPWGGSTILDLGETLDFPNISSFFSRGPRNINFCWECCLSRLRKGSSGSERGDFGDLTCGDNLLRWPMLPAWSEGCGIRNSGARLGVLSIRAGSLDDLESASDERFGTNFLSLCSRGRGSCEVGGEVTLLEGACADEVWVVGVAEGEVEGGLVGEKGTVIAGKMVSFSSGLGLVLLQGTGERIPGDRNPLLSWCSFCCYQRRVQ